MTYIHSSPVLKNGISLKLIFKINKAVVKLIVTSMIRWEILHDIITGCITD